MAQSFEEIKSIIAPWQFVTLTCKGPVPFNNEPGYAWKAYDDYFEFREVLNKNEHFSNTSDDPETKIHVIKYSDVILLKKGY